MRKRLARVRSKRSSLKVTFSVILSILTSRKLYQLRQGAKKNRPRQPTPIRSDLLAM
jgi:hypothetical protein